MLEVTHIAIESAVNQEVSESILATRYAAEESFLYGRAGAEFLGLHTKAESMSGERINYWHYDGNVGNDPGKIGPGHPSVTYSFAPGEVATLNVKGSPLGQANLYFYIPLQTPSALPRRVVDIRTFQVPDLKPQRALEWQCQVVRGGKLYNMAYQLETLDKVLKYFTYDGPNKGWHPVPVQPPFPDLTKPVTIKGEFWLVPDLTTHAFIEINGTRYQINVSQPCSTVNKADKMTAAIQVDPFKDGSCTVLMSQMDVRYV